MSSKYASAPYVIADQSLLPSAGEFRDQTYSNREMPVIY